MSSYVVEFIAYIDRTKCPKQLDDTVSIFDIHKNVESTDHLKYLVNKKFLELVTSVGIIALKEPHAIIDEQIVTFDKRRFIPWHMITHLEAKVTLMPEPTKGVPDLLIPMGPETEPEKGPLN